MCYRAFSFTWVYLAKKYPELKIGVVTLGADDLAGAMTSRRCHLVVGTGKLEQKTISQFELYDDHFGFFTGKKLKERSRKTPLIYVARAKDDEGHTLGSTLNVLEEEGHRFELDTFETVHAMVLEGLGVGVLPLRLAQASVEAGPLIATSVAPLGRKFGKHRFYGSVSSEDLDDARTMTVLNELRDWCSR
jgi:DNA-binding transcriptional LysR family regulator